MVFPGTISLLWQRSWVVVAVDDLVQVLGHNLRKVLHVVERSGYMESNSSVKEFIRKQLAPMMMRKHPLSSGQHSSRINESPYTWSQNMRSLQVSVTLLPNTRVARYASAQNLRMPITPL